MNLIHKIKPILIGLLFFAIQVSAQKPVKTVKILMIGNSFSQNASRYLPQMAKEANVKLILGRAEMGGCSLKRHWDSVVVNDIDTNQGKAYHKKSLRQLLASQKWDIVTMQQYSLLSGDESSYQPYAKNLYDLIKAYQPDAEIVVHQTWAYRADAKSFGEIGQHAKAKNQQEMWQRSRAAYHQMAETLGGLRIIPSGDAFYLVATDKKWGFKKDTEFDEEKATYPALPKDENSLNVGYQWTKDKVLKFDANHANEAGCYLSGLLWYKVLLAENPEKVKFRPEGVSPEFAEFLKQTAAKTH